MPLKIETPIYKPEQMCYDIKNTLFEVTTLDEQNQVPIPAEEEKKYTPRPAWQVWAARVALVLFIIIVIGQILRIARGGL